MRYDRSKFKFTSHVRRTLFRLAHANAKASHGACAAGRNYQERFGIALAEQYEIVREMAEDLFPVQPVREATFRSEDDKDRFIRRIAEKTKGKFFTVEFTKRTTGERRVMNAIHPVPSRFANGGGLRFDPTKKRLLSVFDVGKGAPRFASLERVHRVAAKGYSFEFDGLTCRTYQRN